MSSLSPTIAVLTVALPPPSSPLNIASYTRTHSPISRHWHLFLSLLFIFHPHQTASRTLPEFHSRKQLLGLSTSYIIFFASNCPSVAVHTFTSLIPSYCTIYLPGSLRISNPFVFKTLVP
ncbi:hypothetical protein EDB86DRAFT_2878910 [Lactarius hatsudake]|nr:hypothetical protein EDB86DRAFT_2878910 [Lactarius hatsudake]